MKLQSESCAWKNDRVELLHDTTTVILTDWATNEGKDTREDRKSKCNRPQRSFSRGSRTKKSQVLSDSSALTVKEASLF